MHRTRPAFHDYGQVRLDHDQPLQDLFVVNFRVPAIVEAQMQFLYEQTEDHAKLLHCEPFAHAIGRSVRERDESCSVVYELLSGRALKLLLASGN